MFGADKFATQPILSRRIACGTQPLIHAPLIRLVFGIQRLSAEIKIQAMMTRFRQCRAHGVDQHILRLAPQGQGLLEQSLTLGGEPQTAGDMDPKFYFNLSKRF